MAGRIFYEGDFEEAWSAFKADTGSKAKAYEAWKKTAHLRPSQELMLAAIQVYNDELVDFNRTRKPQGQRQKLHMSTWLSVRDLRWEGYLDRAEQIVQAQRGVMASKEASVNASSQTWPTAVLDALRLDDAIVRKWFLSATYIAGPPPEMRCPTRFHADWVLSRWPQQVMRALGTNAMITYP